MATVNKNFKVKHGLVVEGTTGTINGEDILTEGSGDAYIIDLVGGESFITSTSNEFDVSAGKELSLDRTVVDAYYDAAGSADAAETAANGYTDGRETAITTAYEAYADQAEVDAKAYTDTRETAITTAYESYADTAEADAVTSANSYTDGRETAITTAYEAYADTAEQDAKDYADAEIAALVGGAPELLDTLNELAAALQDNPDVIADLQGIAAGKQDELTAGANIDITGATISVTGLDSADISDFDTAALSATSAAYDVAGTAQGIVDALDTDDIEEGVNNLYHTDVRAKTSAANLLTGATLTNITITGDETGLTITAENGVADSTTSDLAEGTNLYFTNQRALDATAAAYDVVGAAATAEGNANDYTDTEIGDLTTDDIEEGETNLYFTNQRALDATAAAYDVVGSGAGALEQANDYTDGEITTALTTAQGYADTAEADAKAYADDLIGDATVDGTSGNTVTARIASAVSNLVDSAPETLDTLNELAAALQDNPDIISDLQDIAAGKQDTLTAGDNIDITGATISVTGLDTDDVSEGTNLYFTDARAVDALEAVVPNFTEVDLNSVATQVAATGSATAATANTVYSFAKADYRSAKFLVKVAYSTHTEISEVLLTLDTSDNIAITEYAIVGTNGSLSTVSAEVSGANVNLLVNPANTSTVTVMGTLLA
jgi:hypothetical protein